ncbi:MAG: DUF4157 domain-containing protein [Gammaproteobacteria bacterium]|nr:DUF4157 domain-containing protein [Gemmatimonadota bacterium]NIU76226.1 DUF4157 domain-containing protein [Gammaproteobacteria bacterium]
MDSPLPDMDGPLPDHVRLRRSRFLTSLAGWLSGMGGAATAVTLGRTIVLRPGVQLGQRLLRHELAHVRQWQAHPWSFPLRYLVGHLRYGYHRNPFEVEARAAERPDERPGSMEVKS